MLLGIDGTPADRLPVTEVVAGLRGEGRHGGGAGRSADRAGRPVS
ncbi:hypothetical protein [Kitasatospora albolonga]